MSEVLHAEYLPVEVAGAPPAVGPVSFVQLPPQGVALEAVERELVPQALALARGAGVRPQHLPPEIRAANPVVGAPWWRGETAVVDLECEAILQAPKHAGGNRAGAVRPLGISQRRLYRKLDRPKLREASLP